MDTTKLLALAALGGIGIYLWKKQDKKPKKRLDGEILQGYKMKTPKQTTPT